MAAARIEALFASNIHRRIEEVIKVDQTDEDIVRDEIDEYVATSTIRSQFLSVFEAYQDAWNKPTDGIGVWVSGFFGSGKSSFAKMLGLAISNRKVVGENAAARFVKRTGDNKIGALLSGINERVPTHAVIFDVSTDKGIKSGNQTMTEIMYRLFLQSLGYAKDLDLSELEIVLEEQKRLEEFKAAYNRIYKKDWDKEKNKIVFALGEASRVIHELEPDTYPEKGSWVESIRDRNDITPGKLADRCVELMKRQKPKHNLLFVVDEVGQFVARDTSKMLDLQAIVQQLGVKGRGRQWLVVTSQEKLGEVVSGLDATRVELPRLMDRFTVQVHLEPSDISEVTSRRVLSKNADAQRTLGKLFDDNRGRLTDSTKLTADIKLPELSHESFVDLYPLLPYQIDLIIQVVSGLRTQGGASKHVGGANRTIIKLAQQLLIHPQVHLADNKVGDLARIDQVYDLVEGNIASEVRAKISSIATQVDPFAQAVAKVICLLQYVKSVHRTAENIAAALHPAVDADSQLPQVKEALQRLVAAHQVRIGDDGYRIPTPAEDDWEGNRLKISAKPGDIRRLHAEIVSQFWHPQPTHTLLETKPFKAGLALEGRDVVEGDLMFQLYLAEDEKEYAARTQELRQQSQQERMRIFWAVPLSDAIDHESEELFRSKEMLSRKERDAKTQDETSLIAEEKQRKRRHEDELKRLLKQACLSGQVYFRGNDRSPGDRAVDVGKSAGEILGQVLPDVFDRFKEAAARVQKRDLDALCTSESLNGLTPVFGSSGLNLLREEKGKVVFRTDSGPLSEIVAKIEQRDSYGDAASGKYLCEEFAKEPFGWDFEVVRLFTVCLLRAGVIEAKSQGLTIDTATSLEARDHFANNNKFRAASFRPKRGIDPTECVKAADAFRDTFGMEVRELNPGVIATELRKEIVRREDGLSDVLAVLQREGLPGAEVLEAARRQLKDIVSGSDDNAILTFNGAHRTIKDGLKRASELSRELTEPAIQNLRRAKTALRQFWPFLMTEADLEEGLRAKATELADVLQRETFYRELPIIDQSTKALEREFDARYKQAVEKRAVAYRKAFDRLVSTPGWSELDEGTQFRIAEPIERGKRTDVDGLPIPQLRAECLAVDGVLKQAVAEVHRIREGERIVAVDVASYFARGVETVEQLDQALDGIREVVLRQIGQGKKVVVS